MQGRLKTAGDWDNPEIPRLWRYNLHYFDDLTASDADARSNFHKRLIQRWISENPPPIGTGWEPYPCSLRIVNWVKWMLTGNDMPPGWQQSLAIQVDWLSKKLEWHLLGNHLFANAKALIFAGLFFEGDAAANWLKAGLEIIKRELPEQVLSDGGHFERSPMYHAIALEDLFDLISIVLCYRGAVEQNVVREWESVAVRMLSWLQVMTHPDGEIALFNDSAIGIALSPKSLMRYGRQLGISAKPTDTGLTDLQESGYVRVQNDDAVLFCDVGPIGPDYLPGHAHADSLGFELSIFGTRWFVDSGCSLYETCDERLRQRGTSAHNTIVVDGQDSSEVWSSFRVARRARPVGVDVQSREGRVLVSAGHDGYRRLPGKVLHHREFDFSNHSLTICDTISGMPQSAVANFLVHPDVQVSQADQGFLLEKSGQKVHFNFDRGDAEVVDTTWHPQFGLSVPTRRISITLKASRLVSTVRWSPDE